MKRYVVTFDLNKYAASYQFLQFLINAEITRPEDHKLVIEFSGKYLRVTQFGRNGEESIRLLKNVMLPALKLIGAEKSDGESGVAGRSHHFIQAVTAARAGKKIPHWKVPDDEWDEVYRFLNGRKPLVITLRECRYWPGRNSNIEQWKGFAKQSGEDVIFIRDTAKADDPLDGFETNPRASKDLLFRAALMLQAKCNLLVANGPIILPLYSDTPWLAFKPVAVEHPNYGAGQVKYWEKNGIGFGGQFPWSKPTQRLIWDTDSLENIERGWAEVSELLKEQIAA